jgi:hypothetical protein
MSDFNPLQDSNNPTPINPVDRNNGNSSGKTTTPVFEFTEPEILHAPGKNIRKKSFRKFFFFLTLLLLLFVLGTAAFVFRDSIRNRYALLTKSPSEYYSYVETNSFHRLADGLWLYQKYASVDSSAYQVTSDISFYRDALDSLSVTALGVSLKDAEKILGISIEQIGFDFLYQQADHIRSETLGVRFNQEKLITLDCYTDILKQEALLRLPELSSSYVKASLASEDISSDLGTLFLELLNSDKSSTLIKRYGELLASSINQVELEKDTEITLDSLSEKVTKLTVTISKEDIFNISSAMLDTARTDEDILALLPSLGRTTADYQETIDTAKVTLWNSYSDSNIESLQMLLYVDDKGHIISRSIGSANSSASFSYTYLNRKDYSEYQSSLTDSDGTAVLNAYGNHRKINGTYRGLLNVEYSNPDSNYLTDTSFEVAYEDVIIKPENHHLYSYGTYTLSSDDLMGMQIELDNNVTGALQHNDITLRMGASPLITMDTVTEYLSSVKIEAPDPDAEVYDLMKIEDYFTTLNFEEYLTDLSSRLNINLSDLIASYLP